MKLPDPLSVITGFMSTVIDYGEKYWIYAIIMVVFIIGFIIYSVVK